jgi:TetR/AcrR family transcriptional repressor of nem operon
MSREREFDHALVVERALMVFWRLGYDGSSVSELVSSTGVQRQSLYNAFGDKRGLFVAALQFYRERALEALAPLASPSAGVVEVQAYMRGVLELQRTLRCGACFMVKTAFGHENGDEEIRILIEETSDSVRSAFANAIQRSVSNGELPASTEPHECARFLYSLLHGLSALMRTGGTMNQASNVLVQTFRGLSVLSSRC